MVKGLEAWYSLIHNKDAARLDDQVADGAVFHSPVIHRPQEGKALTVRYLAAANAVLNNGTFRYVGEWTSSNSAVLEFNCEIDGVTIDGADFITWNDDGRIVDFKVMIRPLKAIEKIMQKMGEELARAEK
ncbi:MAG: nuclear transport factor 2 family protein [Mesorhizobium sp.]